MIMSNQDASSFSALILSSGMSERMGRPKARLHWDSSQTFLEKIISDFLKSGCSKVICTVNHLLLPWCESILPGGNVRFILNEHPEWGRMHSVRLGLNELQTESYCLIHNIDNPFINPDSILKILSHREPYAWCSPEFEGKGGHPVMVANSMITKILRDDNHDKTLQQVLMEFPKRIVPMEDDTVLRNINSPADYQRYFGQFR
jgi:CTP:molybdopterin cytidylyltransferase MocA